MPSQTKKQTSKPRARKSRSSTTKQQKSKSTILSSCLFCLRNRRKCVRVNGQAQCSECTALCQTCHWPNLQQNRKLSNQTSCNPSNITGSTSTITREATTISPATVTIKKLTRRRQRHGVLLVHDRNTTDFEAVTRRYGSCGTKGFSARVGGVKTLGVEAQGPR
jgi:hypothetical protein